MALIMLQKMTDMGRRHHWMDLLLQRPCAIFQIPSNSPHLGVAGPRDLESKVQWKRVLQHIRRDSSVNRTGLTSPWNTSLALTWPLGRHHRSELVRWQTKLWRRAKLWSMLGKIARDLGLIKPSCMRRMRFGRLEQHSMITVGCLATADQCRLCSRYQKTRCFRRLARRHPGECRHQRRHHRRSLAARPRFTGSRGPLGRLRQCHRPLDHRRHLPMTAAAHRVRTEVPPTGHLRAGSPGQHRRPRSKVPPRRPGQPPVRGRQVLSRTSGRPRVVVSRTTRSVRQRWITAQDAGGMAT